MKEIIKDNQIKLSKYQYSDVELVYKAIKNSYTDVAPWLPWLTADYCRSSIEDFVIIQLSNWDSQEEYCFTIKDFENNFLGAINVHIFDSNNGVASIGYWMDSTFNNQGYGTQALKLLVDKSFSSLNLNRIEVIVALDNVASQRVAEKAGAKLESIQKNRLLSEGLTHDAKMFVFIPQ